ncbi:MAG: HAD hydrolase-like protein, partial [Bacillota bacterium]|nr:HAD hydrolase-like protein [Bacillota bacterium]
PAVCAAFAPSLVGGFGDEPGEKWDAALRGVAMAEALWGAAFLPENVFLIGDSPYDVRCARRLGFCSVAVASGFSSYETLSAERPDHLLETLADTPGLKRILNL